MSEKGAKIRSCLDDETTVIFAERLDEVKRALIRERLDERRADLHTMVVGVLIRWNDPDCRC